MRKSYWRKYKSSNDIVNLTIGLFVLALIVKLLDILFRFVERNLGVLTGVGLVLIGWAIYKYSRRFQTRFDIISIEEIDKMDPTDFEHLIAGLFRLRGYQVTVTPRSGDKGADVIVERKGQRTAIQAKRYGNNADHKGVQEVYGSLNYYKCSKGIVITNRYFTKTAQELARVNHIELWDRDRLLKEIKS